MGNSGFHPPFGRTTINLAPADKKKEGPSFDLPIALGMLAADKAIDAAALEGVCRSTVRLTLQQGLPV